MIYCEMVCQITEIFLAGIGIQERQYEVVERQLYDGTAFRPVPAEFSHCYYYYRLRHASTVFTRPIIMLCC